MRPRPTSIKVRALQWLAQREHSRIELRDKLLRLLSCDAARAAAAAARGQADPVDSADPADLADTADPADSAIEVEALLQWLESRGYLSQQRFVESRVHARQARFGNLRIQQELQQHGVKLDPEAKQALKETELQRAREVWQKKYGTSASDAAGRLKQLRFLAGRGFSMDVARRVVLLGRRSADTDAEPDLADF